MRENVGSEDSGLFGIGFDSGLVENGNISNLLNNLRTGQRCNFEKRIFSVLTILPVDPDLDKFMIVQGTIQLFQDFGTESFSGNCDNWS